MSRTDKDRPYRIRKYDRLEKAQRPLRHNHFYHNSRGCDEGEVQAPGGRNFVYCAPSLATTTPGISRKQYRREWFDSERADQRRITHILKAAANGGWLEDAEDIIDNRKTHFDTHYGGGWEWT